MTNILMTLVIILGVILGAGTCLATIAIMIGTLAMKLYRKIRYGASLYD